MTRTLVRLRFHTPVLCVGLAGLLGGCGSPGQTRGTQRFTEQRVGDTLVARSVSPLWSDTARLVADWMIGEIEGAEAYQFSQVAALAVDRNGAVFVVDGGSTTIRKYSAEGRHLFSFGREGAGPGEFRYANGISVLPDGRILLRAGRNQRINVYDPAGTPIAHWAIPGPEASSRGALVTDTAGTVYAAITLLVSGGDRPFQLAFARLTEAGQIRDTILVPQRYERTCPRETLDASYGLRVPQTPSVLWTFSAAGVIVGCNQSYQFDVIGLDGSVRRIVRSWDPIAITPAEQRFWTDGLTAQMRMLQDPGWRWTASGVPDRKPAYRALYAGERGRLWVRTAQPGRESDRPERMPETYPDKFFTEPIGFDVFEASGEYLGPVAVPEGFRDRPVPVFRGDTVWAVVTDDDGVEYISRFRLTSVARGNR